LDWKPEALQRGRTNSSILATVAGEAVKLPD
jgi:hypothetical protein